MQQFQSKSIAIFLITSLFLLLSGCYYNNEEELYPVTGPPACDTINVSYVQVVLPIMEQNCLGCHSKAAKSGNIILEGHDEISVHAQSGRLIGAISHDARFSPMPKGGNKLLDCDISKIKSWVDAGSPNN